MTTRDLEIFIAVAEHGNMSKAAKELYVAPSSVSQTVLDIEKEYNTTLFVRMNKKLLITEKGELLLGYARHMITLTQELEHQMREDIQNRIRIGATLSIGAAVAGEIIREFQEVYPDVIIELIICHTGEQLRYLKRGELDIGLVIREDYRMADFVTIPLLTDRILLGCGREHPFFERTTILPEELNGQPFILRQRGSQIREYYNSLIRAYDIQTKERLVTSDANAQKYAVMENQGLGLLSSSFTIPEVQNGQLRLLEISGANFSRQFQLVYHRYRYINPYLENFIGVCQNYRKRFES